jgi:lipopolysaccharide/colanic/teichoic acid biosynthesis glycosyltransferase
MGKYIYRDYIKRYIDVFVSAVGLVIAAPILLVTAIAIKIDSKGDILFRQKRIGKDGKEFIIYKFRSMITNAEKTGSGQYSYKDDPRVTRVGRVIRATSIDELPQFINIIKGDMSLVGFRPPLTYHPWKIEEYTEEQRKMFLTRPGVTGWAQIHGRKEVQWNDRIEMGIWYVEHVTFWLDAKIILMTVIKVITNANNENTIHTTERNDFHKK